MLTWLSAGLGMAASLLLTLNFWPRGTLQFVSYVFFPSSVRRRDFSGYQSDGMLLEAGFISLFFAPPGFDRVGASAATIAGKSVPTAVGMVSHLL